MQNISKLHTIINIVFNFVVQTKCESYLPDRYGAYGGGDLEVFVHSISERDGYILREITIKVITFFKYNKQMQ